jgi:hypothetical protein
MHPIHTYLPYSTLLTQLSAKAAKRETRVFALGTSVSPVNDAINVECSSDGNVLQINSLFNYFNIIKLSRYAA